MSDKPKRDWIVCTEDNLPICDNDCEVITFRTERAALKRAKETVKAGHGEAWVYRLTHVVSRPDTDPDVEVVK